MVCTDLRQSISGSQVPQLSACGSDICLVNSSRCIDLPINSRCRYTVKPSQPEYTRSRRFFKNYLQTFDEGPCCLYFLVTDVISAPQSLSMSGNVRECEDHHKSFLRPGPAPVAPTNPEEGLIMPSVTSSNLGQPPPSSAVETSAMPLPSSLLPPF